MPISFIKKRCFCALLFAGTFLLFSKLHAKSLPSWYGHQEIVFPPEFYITAVGEGGDRTEAEIDAVAKLSLYFKTTADINNQLLRNYQDIDSDGDYDFSKKTKITERAKISSQAEFLGVQFAEGFVLDGKFTLLAYIDRAQVFDVYSQRIRTNCAVLESLMLVAEDYNNPVLGFEAARKAVPVADVTAELLKMARTVRKTDSADFDYADSLIQRANTALQLCRKNLVFRVEVENDYEGMIFRTVSDLLEDAGYALSAAEGICAIPVKVTASRVDNAAGIFLYCGIVVNVTDGNGETVFSYSRNFPKKGARTESFAYQRAYQAMVKELEATFVQEFSAKIKK